MRPPCCWAASSLCRRLTHIFFWTPYWRLQSKVQTDSTSLQPGCVCRSCLLPIEHNELHDSTSHKGSYNVNYMRPPPLHNPVGLRHKSPVGFGVNKWFEHLWGAVMHNVRSPSSVMLYISTHVRPLGQSKRLVRTDWCMKYIYIYRLLKERDGPTQTGFGSNKQ